MANAAAPPGPAQLLAERAAAQLLSGRLRMRFVRRDRDTSRGSRASRMPSRPGA